MLASFSWNWALVVCTKQSKIRCDTAQSYVKLSVVVVVGERRGMSEQEIVAYLRVRSDSLLKEAKQYHEIRPSVEAHPRHSSNQVSLEYSTFRARNRETALNACVLMSLICRESGGIGDTCHHDLCSCYTWTSRVHTTIAHVFHVFSKCPFYYIMTHIRQTQCLCRAASNSRQGYWYMLNRRPSPRHGSPWGCVCRWLVIIYGG